MAFSSFSWNSTPAPKKKMKSNTSNNSNNAGSSLFSNWGSNQNNDNNSNNNSKSGSAWWSTNNNENNNNNNNPFEFGGFGTSINANNSNNNSNTGFGAGFGFSSSSNTSVINPNNDHIVADPPSDAISCLQFHPNQSYFTVGSWDSSIAIYEFSGKNQSKKLGFQKHNRPVLACCFNESGDTVFSAGCDNQIKAWNPQQNQFVQIGQHQAPIRCVNTCSVNGQFLAISGSWDKTIAIWDVRTNGASTKPVFSNNVGGKVFAMAQKGNMLVVGTSDNDIKTFDLRQSGKLLHSSKPEEKANKKICRLHEQIRCIDIFPDEKGYVAASVGGRVVLKLFDRAKKKKDYSFKCHRNEIGPDEKKDPQHVFGINAIKFHQQSHNCATAGDDGKIVTWYLRGRSKSYSFKPLQVPYYRKRNRNAESANIDGSRMPIVALDYHSNGQWMLYGSSYNYNKGSEYNNPSQQKPQLYLHQTTKKEFKKIMNKTANPW